MPVYSEKVMNVNKNKNNVPCGLSILYSLLLFVAIGSLVSNHHSLRHIINTHHHPNKEKDTDTTYNNKTKKKVMEVLPTGFDNVLMGQKGRQELRAKTQERPVAPCLEGRCDIL